MEAQMGVQIRYNLQEWEGGDRGRLKRDDRGVQTLQPTGTRRWGNLQLSSFIHHFNSRKFERQNKFKVTNIDLFSNGHSLHNWHWESPSLWEAHCVPNCHHCLQNARKGMVFRIHIALDTVPQRVEFRVSGSLFSNHWNPDGLVIPSAVHIEWEEVSPEPIR